MESGESCLGPCSLSFPASGRCSSRVRWSALLVGALEGAVVVGGLSAIGAGLYSLGIPKDSVLRYETALKTGKFIVIAHGSSEEAPAHANIVSRTSPEALQDHQPLPVNAEACAAA